jgi:hypothetical protein
MPLALPVTLMPNIESCRRKPLRWYVHFGLLGLLAAAWFVMANRWGVFSGPTGLRGICGAIVAAFWGALWVIYALCSTYLLTDRIDTRGAIVWVHSRVLGGVVFSCAALVAFFTTV